MTKKLSFTAYEINELSKETKDRAIEKLREGYEIDSYMLEEYMDSKAEEKLTESSIGIVRGSVLNPFVIRYSLSNCQGDGVSFLGRFTMDGCTIKVIRASPHYVHEKSVDFQITFDDDLEHKDEENTKVEDSFKQDYERICRELEKLGYAYIDAELSTNALIELCEANDYLFFSTGKRVPFEAYEEGVVMSNDQ